MPTRRRPKKCIETILLLVKNAEDINNLEIVLACDNDDKDSLNKILENIGKKHQDLILKYRYFDQKGYKKIYEYFDSIVDLVSVDSELLLYLSDDMKIITKSWDKKLLEFHKDKKFGAYFLNARCNEKKYDESPSHVVYSLPKKWIELTERCGLVATDSWTEYVSRQADCIYYVNNVECIFSRNGNDETQKMSNISKRKHSSKTLFRSTRMKKEREIDANKIKEYLKTIKRNDNECK